MCSWQLVVGGSSLVAFALLANLVDKMVGTRASTARLRAATKEELNTPIPNNMPDDNHEDQPEEEQEKEGGREDKVTTNNSFSWDEVKMANLSFNRLGVVSRPIVENVTS